METRKTPFSRVLRNQSAVCDPQQAASTTRSRRVISISRLPTPGGTAFSTASIPWLNTSSKKPLNLLPAMLKPADSIIYISAEILIATSPLTSESRRISAQLSAQSPHHNLPKDEMPCSCALFLQVPLGARHQRRVPHLCRLTKIHQPFR